MSVELVSSLSSGGDLDREREAQSIQLSHLPQQCHQSVAVVDPQLPVTSIKLHQSTTSLQTVIHTDNTTSDTQYVDW